MGGKVRQVSRQPLAEKLQRLERFKQLGKCREDRQDGSRIGQLSRTLLNGAQQSLSGCVGSKGTTEKHVVHTVFCRELGLAGLQPVLQEIEKVRWRAQVAARILGS